MRWPWQKRDTDGAAIEPSEGSDTMSWGRDYEDDERDEEEAGDAEEADELADLDDETRERVAAMVASAKATAAAEERAAVRTALQEQGWDLAEDRKPLVADPARVAQFVAAFQPKPPAAPPQDAEAGGDDDAIPDPYTSPKEFRAWMAAQNKAAIDAGLGELKPQLEANNTFRMTAAQRDAIDRVKRLVPGHDYLSGLVAPEHVARFEEVMRQHLQGYDAQALTDENLLKLASAAIVDVYPKKAQGRDEAGRFASERARNATLYQDSFVAHPDGARAPRQAVPTDDERRVAAQWGMTVDQARALSGEKTTYEEFAAAEKAAKGKK